MRRAEGSGTEETPSWRREYIPESARNVSDDSVPVVSTASAVFAVSSASSVAVASASTASGSATAVSGVTSGVEPLSG